MKFINLILILILFSTPSLNAEGLGDLNTSNTLAQLNLSAMKGGDLDPKVWERIIKKLTDEESQQQWRGLLNNQKLLKSLSNYVVIKLYNLVPYSRVALDSMVF